MVPDLNPLLAVAPLTVPFCLIILVGASTVVDPKDLHFQKEKKVYTQDYILWVILTWILDY